MKMPHIIHKRKSPKTEGEIWVLAYRDLSDQEVEQCILSYFPTGKAHPKRGQVMKIYTGIS